MTFLFIIFALLSLNYFIFLLSIVRGIRIVKNDKSENDNKNFVSVIIPFRNEEENLLKNLASIESQSVPKTQYEIIYVNDNSDDNSVNVLENAKSWSNVKIINSDLNLEERGHKKIALTKAIEEAKGEIIITTDADCIHGRDWLKTMINKFDDETAFVSGPVEFIEDETTFSKLQRLEFSSLILVGAGLIGKDEPIICNAANLGFRKSVFNLVNGYEGNLNLSSGDDEFLMQKIANETKYKIKFCFDDKAKSFTQPNSTISQFFNQRKRWASKSLYYVKKSTTLKLVMIFLFYLGIIAQLILGLFYNQLFWLSFFFSMILKVITEYQIVQIDSKELFTPANLKIFFLAELLHIPYIIISGFSGLFGNYEWKGRKIKR